MFKIESRYEYISATGKEWCRWFDDFSSNFKTKNEAEESLQQKSKLSEPIEKSTKLKIEYRIAEV